MSDAITVSAPQATSEGCLCLNCGYDLAGLSAEDRCPECGSPVERSLRGAMLIYSSPEYLKKLHTGLFLIQLGIILTVLLTVVGAFVGIFAAAAGFGAAPGGGGAAAGTAVNAFTLASSLLGIGVAFVSLAGWWLFTTPDPALSQQETGKSARLWVRGAVVARAAMSVVQLVAPFALAALPFVAILLGLVGAIVWAVQFFAAMLYLRWLAPRLPSGDVDRRAKRFMWLGPLLYIVGSLIIIGPLIALILYYNLLDDVRKRLKRIRQDQEAAGLGAAAVAAG